MNLNYKSTGYVMADGNGVCPVLLWLAVQYIHCTPHTKYVYPIYVVYSIAIAWYNKDNYLTASTQREYGAESK